MNNDHQESAALRIVQVVTTYGFRLFGINLLFLITCIPIITIPAAICSLHAVVQMYYCDQYQKSAFQVYFKEFRVNFLLRCILWGVFVLFLGILFAVHQCILSVISLVFCALGFLMALLLFSWLIPQLVMYDLTIVDALKNSFIFTALEYKVNLGIILLNLVCSIAIAFAWPLSLMAVLVVPVFYTIILTGIVVPKLHVYLRRETDT